MSNDTPIQLLRFGPPEFNRMDAFEDAICDGIDEQSKEEIEKELREAGIDMAPAIAKMRAMIDAKKAAIAKAEGTEVPE